MAALRRWTPEAERKVLRERGQAVLEQIRQASASGAGQVRITPGDVLLSE